MKVLLVGSQHGDEKLGDKLIAYIEKKKPELLDYIDFYLANPRAHQQNKRFIEEDMNRAYKSTKNTYEANQCKILIDHISSNKYDLVLDLHTTNAKMASCFINSKQASDSVQKFINLSNIKNVVLMSDNIVEGSLCGILKRAISIEVNVKGINDSFLNNLTVALDDFIVGKSAAENSKNYFEVYDFIKSTDYSPNQFNKMRNFELFNDELYPILIGSKSYKKFKKYLGFKAKKLI